MPPESLEATTPQLNFALNNPGAPGTIYVSTNPADNTLSLVMTSTVQAGFSAGTLVPPSSAPGGTGSLLYLDLTPLGMTSAEFDALSLVADGWTSQLYPESPNQYIGFTPTSAVTLNAGSSITFALQGFTLAQQPRASATLTVSAYRVTGITSIPSFPFQTSIGVSFSVPDDNTGDLTTVMTVSMTPAQVVNSVSGYPSIANNLTLTFTQVPNQPVVSSGDDTAFSLNFVYATDPNGYGALLTTAEGQALAVNPAQGTTGWIITPNLDADPPNWTLAPPANTPLFSEGTGATIAFDIGNLVTTFQPGPTVVIISYSNVPGYKNGSFAITLIKEPHVQIGSFTVSPEQSVLQDGSATVQLSWSTTYATQLILQPLGTDVTGKTSTPATIQESTQFTLVAQGQRPGNVDNVASSSVWAEVLPVINSFTSTPGSIYVGDFNGSTGYPTTLAWNVNTNENVTLTSSTTGNLGSYSPQSSLPRNLTTPQMLTLTPQGGAHDPTVSRSLVVSGFQLQAQQATTGHDSGFAAAPSNAGFVAVTSPTENLVAILSTANFASLTTVPVGSSPQGIAFSPDGSTMFVANSGDGTVSVFTVAAAQTSPPFTFASAGTVNVGGAPQQVAVGAAGTAWVSVDLGAGTAGQVVPLASSGGTWSAGTALTVGNAPRGVALSPSGASLYVANSGSDSISLVTIGGGTPAVGTLLTGITQPLGVAVTPDGRKLLVAAHGEGAVYGYNTQYAATSPRQTYTLAGATSVAVLPTGDYAIATGTGPNTAALLNYAQGTAPASQALSAAPGGVAVMPEGGMAVVALPGGTSVEVVTFAQYAQVAATTPAGGQVMGVAVSPDNQTLLAWFNALITFTSSGPAQGITGVVKGPVSGTSLTPYLAGQKLNAVAISPAAADDAFYVAVHGQAQIGVYSLSSVASIATIPIPLNGFASRQPVGVAVSGDGRTVFALVSDGGNQFSFVVISADVASKSFSVVADEVAYTASMVPAAWPFGAGPTAGGGYAAYAADATSGKLWTISGSGSSWSVGPALDLAGGVSPAPAPIDLAISPDGGTAWVLMQTGVYFYISTVNLAAGTAVLTFLPNQSSVTNLTALAVSADGQTLYASDGAAAAIRVLNARSLRIDQTLSWQSNVQAPMGIAAASDGTGLFSANLNSKNIAIAQQVNPA